MALTIAIEGLGVLTDAESTTGWGTTGTISAPQQESDLVLQGSYAVSTKASAKAGWLYYNYGSQIDFVTTYAGQCVYLWVNCTTLGGLDTLANYALAVRMGTDTSNYRTWTIGGNDGMGNGYNGGWLCVVIDPTKAGSITDTGTYSAATVQYIGMYIDMIGSSKSENLIIDTIAVGKGLRITGTDVTGWQEVSDYCNDYTNRAWGMFQEKWGLYYVTGKLWLGNTTQTAVTSLTDQNRVFRFGDFEYYSSGSAWVSALPADYNGLEIQDAASYTTTFEDGVIVGTDAGRAGSIFIGSAGTDASFDLYGGNNAASVTKLYGTTFSGITDGVTWGNDSDHHCYSVTFNDCGQFDPVGAVKIRNCVFSGYTPDADGALKWNANIDIKDSVFAGNTDATNDPHAIEHESAGTFTYDGLTFSGNDWDINNASSATQVDAYPDTNRDAAVQLYSGSTTRIAQSFVATAGVLSRAIFSLQKVGTPTGNVVAKLYSDTGGSGPGSVLATSEVVDIANIGTSWAQVDFEFEDEFTLVATTTYWISVEYTGGDSSNRLEVGVDSSTPTHSGQCYTYVSSWSLQTYDMCFYVNRDGIVIINATNGADPTSAEETATTKGATIIKNAVTLTVTCKNTYGFAVQGIRVRIEKTSDGSLISEGTTNASGIFTDSYNYTGDVPVNIIARLKGYLNNEASDTIGSGGLSVPFTMIRDQAVDLP